MSECRRLTDGNTFADKLRAHGLTVNQFLDLRDEWNSMPASDRCDLLIHDSGIEGEESHG